MRKFLVVLIGLALVIGSLGPVAGLFARTVDAQVSHPHKVIYAPKLVTGTPPLVDESALEKLAKLDDRPDAFFVTFSGPVSSADRQRLESMVMYVDGYLQDFSFLVVAKPSQLLNVYNGFGDRLSGIYAYPPKMRIDPRVAKFGRNGLMARVYRFGAGRQTQGLKPQGLSPVDAALTYIRGADGVVLWVEPKPHLELLNDVAAEITKVKPVAWETYGYDGSGQITAVADTGIDTGTTSTMIPDLANRVVAILNHAGGGWDQAGDPNDEHGHGTHVSGSVVGDGTYSGGAIKGMAPGAGLVFQAVMDSNGSLSGIPDDLGLLFGEAHDHGARLHSNSWGVPLSYGGHAYDDFTASADQYLWNTPDMTVLFAAGNDGDSQDEHSVTLPGTAKNVITVGASENYRPSHGSDGDNPDDIAWFSSRGPAPDGRVKPDVVAPGTWILSVKSADAPSSNFWADCDYDQSWCDRYAYMGGTSMATPITNGFTTVVRGYLVDKGISDPTSSLLKAVLIAGAKPLGDGYPNKDYGWGRIDMSGIIPEYEAGNMIALNEDQTAQLNTGDQWTYTFSVKDYNHDLRVVLVWRDYPGEPNAEKELVNDLDLVVVDPMGNEIKPVTVTNPDCGDGTRDNTNNVEVVRILTPLVGNYTVKVKAYNVPYGPQPFSLVIRGALGQPEGGETNPPTVTINSPEDGAVVGGVVNIDATATDDSGVYATKLYIDDTLVLTATSHIHLPWNTYTVSNGQHVIKVEAIDVYGNVGSSQVTITVNNGYGNAVVHVNMPDGTPAQGAGVVITHLTLGNTYTATTDNTGAATFENVASGDYKVFAKKGSYAASGTLTVPADGTGEVTLTLQERWLLVDDDKGGSVESYYEEALDYLGVPYDVVEVPSGQPLPDDVNLFEYYAVVWFTGSDYSYTLLDSDRQRLAAYMNAGGRVWIAGGDILYDTYSDDTNFYNTYFGVKYEGDLSTGSYDVQGVDGTYFEGMSFTINGSWPEKVSAVGDGVEAIRYVGGSPDGYDAATYVVGGWRGLYTGFGLEHIQDEATRHEFISRVQQVLTGEVVYPPVLQQPDQYYTYSPNFTVQGTASPGLTIKIYDNQVEVGQTTAGEDGSFSYNMLLAPAKNVITARACSDSVCSGYSNPIYITYIPDSGPGNLVGTVTKDEQPVEGAIIKLVNQDYGLIFTATTDSSGHYAFTDIPGVVYDATAQSQNPPGYWSGTATVEPNTTTTLDIALGDAKPWTIILYINADNNLSSYGEEDLNEFEYGLNTDQVSAIALLDQDGSGDSRVYEVHHDDDMSHLTSPIISVPGIPAEANMGDPATLTALITFAVENYPAQHYALFIWNHGAGWLESTAMHDKDGNVIITPYGVSYDDTDNDHLTMLEVKQALADAYQITGARIDVMDYDACLMANMEVAYQTRQYVKYLTASEQTEPGDGDDYVAIGQALTNDPMITPLDLADAVAHSFVYQYSSDVTKAVIDSDRLEDMMNALDAFGGLLAQAKLDGEPVDSWISNAHSFYGGYYKDLYDIALKAYQGTSNQRLKDAAEKLMDLIDGTNDNDGAVVKFYEIGHDAAKGISIEYHTEYGSDNFYRSMDSSLYHLWDETLMVLGGAALPRVQITVVDTASSPVADAQIHISGPSADFVAYTDGDGLAGPFFLDGGQFNVTVHKDGYQDATATFDTNENNDIHLTIVLQGQVTDEPPVVSMNVSDGDVLSGVATITITATDDHRVMYIRFYVDDELYSVCSGSTGATFSCDVILDTTMFENGEHVLKADAADNHSQHGTSTVTVTFNNPIVPQVEIVSPQDGATVSGVVHIVATATDDGQIVEMGILIDGTQVATCTATTICTYDWDTGRLPPAGHVIRAYATDNDGYTSWAQVEVTETTGWKKQQWDMEPGWNLITIDVTSSQTLSELFPDAISIFRLEGSTLYYAGSETPVPGKGYLLKYRLYKHVEIWGEAIVPTQCIDVANGAGWFAIGPTMAGIKAQDLYGVAPDGETMVQILSVFGYEHHSLIFVAPTDELELGKGYFVKTAAEVDKICWSVPTP